MGLSSLLVDTYRRYKRDTKIFTQWLGTTAQATGLVDDTLKVPGNKSSNSKKRKNGRNSKPSKQFGTYKVSVQSYLKLAEAVKDMDESKVPCRILGVLEDVIAARKECAAWYRAQQNEESGEAKQHNDGHQHIIGVFEQVYQTLSPLAGTPVANKTAKSTTATERVNLFDLLEVEECPDMEPEADWVPAPPKKVAQDTYEPEVSPEDISFALYCFMKDMTEIRIFIRQTWREYKRKHITPNSAALTVNVAIDATQSLNEAFIQNYPEFAEHSSLIATSTMAMSIPTIKVLRWALMWNSQLFKEEKFTCLPNLSFAIIRLVLSLSSTSRMSYLCGARRLQASCQRKRVPFCSASVISIFWTNFSMTS
jgi:hypothetical protein